MEPEEVELRARLRRAIATKDLAASDDVDLRDAPTVDRLCERLLKWFYTSAVGSESRDEAFALLVETAALLLDDAVLRLRRERGLAVPSEKLVDALFAEMYLGVGAPRLAEKAFLAAAVKRVDGVIDEALALVSGESIRSTAGAAIAEGLVDLGNLAGDELDRLNDDLRHLYCAAFHGLALRDRQILLCRCVDELSEAETAEEMNLPLHDVDVLCQEALERFEALKESALDDPSLGASP